MRHGTNNLLKFEYVVTVTRERPTNGNHTSRTPHVSISNLCQFSLSKLEFPPTHNLHLVVLSLITDICKYTLLWQITLALKWQTLLNTSPAKFVRFLFELAKWSSTVFLRYSTVRDFSISKPDVRYGTVQYGKGTVPVLYCTVPYFIIA